jgi:hypothetical protein
MPRDPKRIYAPCRKYSAYFRTSLTCDEPEVLIPETYKLNRRPIEMDGGSFAYGLGVFGAQKGRRVPALRAAVLVVDIRRDASGLSHHGKDLSTAAGTAVLHFGRKPSRDVLFFDRFERLAVGARHYDACGLQMGIAHPMIDKMPEDPKQIYARWRKDCAFFRFSSGFVRPGNARL